MKHFHPTECVLCGNQADSVEDHEKHMRNEHWWAGGASE